MSPTPTSPRSLSLLLVSTFRLSDARVNPRPEHPAALSGRVRLHSRLRLQSSLGHPSFLLSDLSPTCRPFVLHIPLSLPSPSLRISFSSVGPTLLPEALSPFHPFTPPSAAALPLSSYPHLLLTAPRWPFPKRRPPPTAHSRLEEDRAHMGPDLSLQTSPCFPRSSRLSLDGAPACAILPQFLPLGGRVGKIEIRALMPSSTAS